jgi:hypothetical protein
MITDASANPRMINIFLVVITSSCYEDSARNCFIPSTKKE